jgi:hypothetical protein
MVASGHYAGGVEERHMNWEPIELSERDVTRFAQHLARLDQWLDDDERSLLQDVIQRAGGDRRHGDSGSSNGQPEPWKKLLEEIWSAGTIIAPLYSGAMPEGGGTVD